jgi:DNA replication protein DnaC
VVHHLVINKLNPLFEQIFIHDSCSCRKGKGTHFGIQRVDRFIRQCSLTNEQYPIRIARYWKLIRNDDLLVLDDFGFRRYDSKEAEILYSLADLRLGSCSTILTSNRPAQDWYGVFPDPVTGGAILDRLVSGAINIIVEKAKSYRKSEQEYFPER